MSAGEITRYAPGKIYENLYVYITQLVERTNPDLIIIPGDVIYGEFDDAGTSLTGFISFMEGFGIPWAPVMGNHDGNESAKGAAWQCQQYINAPNCLFKTGTVKGYGNYTIGIRQGGELVRTIYMMDKSSSVGFGADQKEWLDLAAQRIADAYQKSIPAFLVFHIPVNEFQDAAIAAGYQLAADGAYIYTIGANSNGDFGAKGEAFKSIHAEPGLLALLKKHNFDGVFVGHNHLINTSVLYQGIRWTFGLKTGKYDRYPTNHGGTSILVEEGGAAFVVSHVYCD